jgi:hypothetical protein
MEAMVKAKRKPPKTNRNGSQGQDAPRVSKGNPDYMTVPAAADWLLLSEAIRRFLTQKRIQRFKSGGRTLVLAKEVKALLTKVE